MAKEIPFFKFFVGEWANGDITAESYKTQGVFINICSVYWTKEGELSEVFLRKKIKANKEISSWKEVSTSTSVKQAFNERSTKA